MDVPTTFTVAISDLAGNVASMASLHPGAIFTPTNIMFQFAAFTNAAATDFSQANSISFVFDPQMDGADFRLDRIGTTEIAAIPEPAAPLFLAGFGLTALLRRRSQSR